MWFRMGCHQLEHHASDFLRNTWLCITRNEGSWGIQLKYRSLEHWSLDLWVDRRFSTLQAINNKLEDERVKKKGKVELGCALPTLNRILGKEIYRRASASRPSWKVQFGRMQKQRIHPKTQTKRRTRRTLSRTEHFVLMIVTTLYLYIILWCHKSDHHHFLNIYLNIIDSCHDKIFKNNLIFKISTKKSEFLMKPLGEDHFDS